MYYNLKTRKLPDNIRQDINQKKIILALRESYKNTAFSTFPYITMNYNSEKSIDKYTCGNCIALSIYLQKYLNKKYGIKSFLVPATVPFIFSHDEYLELSHVALAIPKNKNKIYIADTAFYFLNPIKVILNSEKERHVYSKDIYCQENNKYPKNYKSLEKVLNRTKKTNYDLILNPYQNIEKDTYYSECCFYNNKNDIWKYFLTEILNPDEAISNFFSNIKNNPFIVSTTLDKNGVCISNYHIKFKDNKIYISKHLIPIKTISYQSVLENFDEFKKLIKVELKMEKFFNDDLIDSIYNFIKNEKNIKENILIKD